jgi:predicted AAA+ superfamily ATPase
MQIIKRNAACQNSRAAGIRLCLSWRFGLWLLFKGIKASNTHKN